MRFACPLPLILCVACSDASVQQPPAESVCDSCLAERRLALGPTPFSPVDSLTPVVVKTYDGSNQVIHPDAITFPFPLHGWAFGLLAMPYPNREGREKVEHPSFYVSNNYRYWTTVTGAQTNPIAFGAPNAILSDNSILYDSALGGLRVYYRENVPNLPDHVLTKTSGDGGVTWSAAREVLPGLADAPFHYLSPTEVYRRIWYVSVRDGCNSTNSSLHERTSADGESFGAETTDSLVQPGYVPWHINIVYNAGLGLYTGLLAAYRADSGCAHTDLFLITSADGTHWTAYLRPVMASTYESTFLAYDAQRAMILFSLIGHPYGTYTLAIGQYGWPELLARVGGGP